MKKVLPIILMLLIILAACSKQEPDPTPTPTATSAPTPTPSPSPSPTPILYYSGLTGEASEEEFGNNRPYAIMLNNIQVAMPQCGIGEADIIYEVLAEGGITRMLAIFSDISGVGAIGSMRSIRPYYIEIALSYDAIIVHAGGSEDAYYDLSVKKCDNIDGVRGMYGGYIFYRDPDRKRGGYEHSLFTTSDLLEEYTPLLNIAAEHDGWFDYGLYFSEDGTPDNGDSATSIKVSFQNHKNTEFIYDSDLGCYIMRQYGADYIDGNTGEALHFENVVVMYADTVTLDAEGRLAVDLAGSGEGLYASGGQSADIVWSHSGSGKPFSYKYPDGITVTFGAGKTFICIVPTGSTVTAD